MSDDVFTSDTATDEVALDVDYSPNGYGLPAVDLDAVDVAWAQRIAAGLLGDGASRDEALATLDEQGRWALSGELAVAGGVARQVASALAAIEILFARSERFDRYVRVSTDDIQRLALDIQAELLAGNIDAVASKLVSNLTDLTEPVTFFTKRKGFAASRIRNKATDDLTVIHVTLADLYEVFPDVQLEAAEADLA